MYHTDERIIFKDEFLAMGVKSILCVPLMVKRGAIGVFGLGLPYREDVSTLEDTSQAKGIKRTN